MLSNSIYEGDNLEVLQNFSDNSIDLIYADPPFYSGKPYELFWKDEPEKRGFEDRWAGGINTYIEWMEPRLKECYRVLKPNGTFYLHCDSHANYKLRELLEKIFKNKNSFRNEIIWFYPDSPGRPAHDFPNKHDTIFRYVKYDKPNGWVFNDKPIRIPILEASIERYKTPRTLGGRDYTGGASAEIGKIPEDVWRMAVVKQNSEEAMGYPTQKPLKLLERIILASSNKGDMVLDPFCGCGTTLVEAQKLERNWIGIDFSPTACKLMAKRLKKLFTIDVYIVRGTEDMSYVKKLKPFEFQNWVVVDKFNGNVSKTKSGDFGIDGNTPLIKGGFPIQVKQSPDIGRNVIDNFETAMRRVNKKKGYIVAYSFGKGAVEEASRVRNEEGLEIILRTVQDLLDGKIE
jgi:DNA modification methylase